MTTLLLIRHGESRANREKVFAGNFDAALQDTGIAQAKITAKYISENYKVDKIYASDLRRAYDTATPLAEILKLEIIKSKEMREIQAGAWEGVKFTEIAANYPEEYGIWIKHIGHARCTDGESTEELGQRVMAELKRIAEENDGKTVAIATHATPIRVSQCLITHGSLEEMENIPWVSNASVTVYEYDMGKWSIKDVSLDAHLAENKTVLPPNV